MNRAILIYIIALLALPVVVAETMQFVYDANGNLISGDGKLRVYNDLNQLSEIRNGSNASAPLLEVYVYHPVEERVLFKKVFVAGNWSETVYYINKNFIQVKNDSGTYNTTYVYQDGVLVAQRSNGATQFIHPDHLGSATLVTDEFTLAVENTTYEPFGAIISGGKTTRFDYTGKEFSTATDDYDYGARRYSPGIRIFLKPDPEISMTYNPQNLNGYAYALNNPYKYVDPDGRKVELAMRNINIIGGSAGSHAYLIMTPENPRDFDADYLGDDGKFTYGGSPENGVLVIKKDEAADSQNKGFQMGLVVPTPAGMSDTEHILAIKKLYDYYDALSTDQKLKYDLLDLAPSYDNRWGNSNVAATSLLTGSNTHSSFFNSLNPPGLNPGLGRSSERITQRVIISKSERNAWAGAAVSKQSRVRSGVSTIRQIGSAKFQQRARTLGLIK